MRVLVVCSLILSVAAGCGVSDEEAFTVTPAQPLVRPDTLVLPVPTPGGTNLAERS